MFLFHLSVSLSSLCFSFISMFLFHLSVSLTLYLHPHHSSCISVFHVNQTLQKSWKAVHEPSLSKRSFFLFLFSPNLTFPSSLFCSLFPRLSGIFHPSFSPSFQTVNLELLFCVEPSSMFSGPARGYNKALLVLFPRRMKETQERTGGRTRENTWVRRVKEGKWEAWCKRGRVERERGKERETFAREE